MVALVSLFLYLIGQKLKLLLLQQVHAEIFFAMRLLSILAQHTASKKSCFKQELLKQLKIWILSFHNLKCGRRKVKNVFICLFVCLLVPFRIISEVFFLFFLFYLLEIVLLFDSL